LIEAPAGRSAAGRREDLLLFALAWIAQLPLLARGFASEDFVILRRLLAGGLGEGIAAQFVGPWLRLTGIGFYRPVGTAALGAEIALFGTSAWPYLLVHSGVHAASAVLVAGLVRRWLGPQVRHAGWFAGALFALHPLALNATAFIASFATVFGVALGLGALRCWWGRPEDRGPAPPRWLALVLFVLALGSYELAAVLPALVVLAETLAPGLRQPAGSGWRSRLRSWWAWWALLAGYLAWRRLLFGGVLGGYEETASLITRLDLTVRLPEAMRALAYVFVPLEAGQAGLVAGLVVAFGVVVLPPLLARLDGRSSPAAAFAAAAFAVGWVVLALAPFGVVRLVPAVGRYAYLAAVGCAFGLALLAEWVGVAWGQRAAALLRGLLLLVHGLAFGWFAGVQLEAGRLVEAVRTDLVARAGGRPGPLLCLDYPQFVTNRQGVPLAQVFHYGLADSVRPPFGPLDVEVFALTPGVVRDPRPVLAALRHARLLRWQANERRFVRIEGASFGPAPPLLVAEGPPAGARWPLSATGMEWSVAAGERQRCDVVVVAAGNAHRAAGRPSDGRCGGVLPADFLATQARLYGGGAYWWVEVSTAGGALEGASPARRLELGRTTAAGWE
jgi:hypothetical protein